MKKKFLSVLMLTAGLFSLASCQGAQGDQGPEGPAGVAGKDGLNGADGKDGKDGVDGKDGIDGKDGQDGKDGTSFLTGKGTPASSLGNDGDSYLDLYSYDLYTKAKGVWTKQGNIKGQSGTSGSTGSEGKTAWSNTILSSTGGYITASVGSAIVGEEVKFTFVPTSNNYLLDCTIDGWKTKKVVNATGNYEWTVKMQEGGYVVGANFGTEAQKVTIGNGDNTNISGNIPLGTGTKSNVEITSSGDIEITSGSMTGETSQSTTPSLKIQSDDTETTKTVTIKSDVSISNYDLELDNKVELVIEEGANVTFKNVTLKEGSSIKGTYKKSSVTTNSLNSINSFKTLTANSSSKAVTSFDIEGDIKIEGAVTLEGLKIKGRIIVNNTTGKFVMKNCYYLANGTISNSNAYLPIKTNEVEITDCDFVLNASVYNFIEWLNSSDSSNKTKSIKISGNTFDCSSMRHNVINFYNVEDNASIDLTNNEFKNVNYNYTQPVRISNFTNSTFSVDVSNSKITNVTNSSYAAYNTFILLQDYNKTGNAQDFTKVTITAKNMNFTSGTTLTTYTSKALYYEKLLLVWSNNYDIGNNVPTVILN